MRDDVNAQFNEIVDYIAGEATPADRARCKQWIEQQPERQALAEDLDRAWRRIQWPAPLHIDVDTIMARVASEIDVAGIDARRPVQTAPGKEGASSLGTLRGIVSTMRDRFAGSAMAALFNRKVTTLTVAEMERLRDLVKHATPEDE